MNNSLNEYLRFNFELNIELNHFLARFNVKMNNQNVPPTPTHQADRLSTEDETIGGYRDCSDGGRLSHQGGCQNHNFCGDDDKEEHKDGDLYDEESSMMTRITMTSIRTAKYLRCE